jgi:hypothetical protein
MTLKDPRVATAEGRDAILRELGILPDTDRRDRWPMIQTPTPGRKAYEDYVSNPLDFALRHARKDH